MAASVNGGFSGFTWRKCHVDVTMRFTRRMAC